MAKARKVKVTPPDVRVTGAGTGDAHWPRHGETVTPTGRVRVLVDGVTRLSSDGRERLYHATVQERRAGYFVGQRVWVSVRCTTWIGEPEKADTPPTGAARRRARKRATVARQAPTKAPVTPAREVTLPTLFQQGATVDK